MHFIFLCTLPILVFSKNLQDENNLPNFCSRIFPLTSDLIRRDAKSTGLQTMKRIRLELNDGETACLHSEFSYEESIIDSNRSEIGNKNRTLNVLYVLQYTNFHQIYPIRQKYIYGLPYLQSKCFCDCPGGEKRCLPSSKYEKCTEDDTEQAANICRSTYHPNQDANGCSNSNDHASVCCQVTVSPYKGWKFVAIEINQPTTFGELLYKIYHQERKDWVISTSQKFQVPFNKITQIQFDHGSLTDLRFISSRPFHDLSPGMYFYQEESNDKKSILHSGPELNKPYEWSFSKLGWFRYNSTTKNWFTDRSSINLQKMLHVKVTNCKEQIYIESFDASYCLFDTNRKNFGDLNEDLDAKIRLYLGKSITDENIWISDASPSTDDRQLIVTQRDPPPIILDFEFNTSSNFFHFLHDLSFFHDFRAEIRLDAFSNRYLKLILINAKGTISGIIYENDAKETNGLSFSHYFRSESKSDREEECIIALPNSIDQRRYICLKSISNKIDDYGDTEICRWAEYKETPLLAIDSSFNNFWMSKKGDCPNCNEDDVVTWMNFLKYLNPKQWFNGISGIPESLAFGVEIVIYIFLLILVTIIFRRLVYPFIKWAICSNNTNTSNNV